MLAHCGTMKRTRVSNWERQPWTSWPRWWLISRRSPRWNIKIIIALRRAVAYQKVNDFFTSNLSSRLTSCPPGQWQEASNEGCWELSLEEHLQ